MTAPRARIIRADQAVTVEPLLAPGASATHHRIVKREEMEAHLAAERIDEEARAKAAAILDEARAGAVAAADATREAAREEGLAQGTAQWLAVRQKESSAIDRSEERAIAMAVLLAERLLGTALELEPSRIASIARGVIAEARGARRATIDAQLNPRLERLAAALRDALA